MSASAGAAFRAMLFADTRSIRRALGTAPRAPGHVVRALAAALAALALLYFIDRVVRLAPADALDIRRIVMALTVVYACTLATTAVWPFRGSPRAEAPAFAALSADPAGIAAYRLAVEACRAALLFGPFVFVAALAALGSAADASAFAATFAFALALVVVVRGALSTGSRAASATLLRGVALGLAALAAIAATAAAAPPARDAVVPFASFAALAACAFVALRVLEHAGAPAPRAATAIERAKAAPALRPPAHAQLWRLGPIVALELLTTARSPVRRTGIVALAATSGTIAALAGSSLRHGYPQAGVMLVFVAALAYVLAISAVVPPSVATLAQPVQRLCTRSLFFRQLEATWVAAVLWALPVAAGFAVPLVLAGGVLALGAGLVAVACVNALAHAVGALVLGVAGAHGSSAGTTLRRSIALVVVLLIDVALAAAAPPPLDDPYARGAVVLGCMIAEVFAFTYLGYRGRTGKRGARLEAG